MCDSSMSDLILMCDLKNASAWFSDPLPITTITYTDTVLQYVI